MEGPINSSQNELAFLNGYSLNDELMEEARSTWQSIPESQHQDEHEKMLKNIAELESESSKIEEDE